MIELKLILALAEFRPRLGIINSIISLPRPLLALSNSMGNTQFTARAKLFAHFHA